MVNKSKSCLLILVLLLFIAGCGESKKVISSLDDLEGVQIAAMTGSSGEQISLSRFPKAETKSFDDIMDGVAALKSDQIEAVITTLPTSVNICRHNPNLRILPETVAMENTCMALRKDEDELLTAVNTIITELREDGTLEDLNTRWLKIDLSPYEEREYELPTEGKPLIVGTSATREPFCFVNAGQQITGHDGELARIVALRLNRPLEFRDMKWSALIPALQSGKIDIIISGMSATEERAKSVNFSQTYFQNSQVIIVKNRGDGESPVESAKNKSLNLRTIDDIEDKAVGVYEGTIHDTFVVKNYPNSNIKRFRSPSDMVTALRAGKLDVAFLDTNGARVILKNNTDLGVLDDNILSLPLGIGFSKDNPGLRESFNKFLAKAKSDGTFDEIYKRWFVDDPEKAQMPKFRRFENGNTILLGVSVGDLPHSAIVNGECVGLDVELAKKFAENQGCDLEILQMEFSSLIAAMASGKVDMIADAIAITEERQKQVAFSDSYLDAGTTVVALRKNLSGSDTPADNVENSQETAIPFFSDVAEGFYNNIIREDRYMLILDGLYTTVIISIFATIFGTFLGAFICFLRMSKRKLVQAIAKIYISILRGTPVLVVLMITFYVIFASVNIDPVLVAVIAFGLNFAAYVSEMFRTGIEGVDKGQTEAGIAMGFTKVKTFLFIILPQATRRILPVYKGEFISLVKMTSIVGYIAVQDLTKASDIIRSRTFDAFFPLIMVAILYFTISWTLMLFLGFIERKTDPKLRLRRG